MIDWLIRTDNAFDLILTINVTCLMVLVSIYLSGLLKNKDFHKTIFSISVSSSLPTTPLIKPVEIWLIFNLVYPFLLVVVATIHKARFLTCIRWIHIYNFRNLKLMINLEWSHWRTWRTQGTKWLASAKCFWKFFYLALT